MPVMEGYRYADEVHERMRDSPTYGCHNHPRREARPQLVQDGWTEDGRRVMVEIVSRWIPERQCGHDESNLDTKCVGCVWRLAA